MAHSVPTDSQLGGKLDTLQRDAVLEVANGTRLVLPRRRREPRDTLVLGNEALVDVQLDVSLGLRVC